MRLYEYCLKYYGEKILLLSIELVDKNSKYVSDRNSKEYQRQNFSLQLHGLI